MAKTWYQTATVKGAFILTLGGLAVAGLNIWQARSQLTQDNQNYKTEIAEKNKTIQSLQQKLSDKTEEIQHLEIELTPFKTIALAKYTGSESEALQELASDIGRLQKANHKNRQKIAELEEELERTKQIAAPPTLSVIKENVRITKSNSGYEIMLPFKSSKKQSLGRVSFVAKIPNDYNARIIKLSQKGAVMNTRRRISSDGKKVEYSFSTSDSVLTMKLEVSEACKVKIDGSHSLGPFDVDIK